MSNTAAEIPAALQEAEMTSSNAEWQTIATVPRDGRLVDLWAQSIGPISRDSDEMRVYTEFRVPDAQWFDGQWCDMDGNPHPYIEAFKNLTFTHWIFPPAPPHAPQPDKESGE
jgi:hypothetical protein